jgi:hypothetical protein
LRPSSQTFIFVKEVKEVSVVSVVVLVTEEEEKAPQVVFWKLVATP